MSDAGLTNGAFYAHFASKEDLVANVLADQLRAQRQSFDAQPSDRAGLERSSAPTCPRAPRPVRRRLPVGCAARRDRPPPRRHQAGLHRRADGRHRRHRLAPRPDRRRGRSSDALTLFGLMVGTLQLARTLTDRDLSDQLLARGVETALKLLDDRRNSCGDGPTMKAYLVNKYSPMKAGEAAEPGRRPRRARRHPRGRRQHARREDPRRRVQAHPPLQGAVRPRPRPRRRRHPRRLGRDALRRGRRGLRAAARRPHRHLRRAHRRARGRSRDQAGEPLHGRGGLRAPRRPDRLAGARRASEPAAGPEGAHPRRLRRRRHLRDPAGQAPRRDRGHHDGHQQRRMGPRPRRRRRHRLPNAGLRDGRARLRRRPGLPGRRHAREVAPGPEARRHRHRHRRPAGPGLRPPARTPPSAAAGHGPAQPEDAPSGAPPAACGTRSCFMRASGAQLDEITKLIDCRTSSAPSSTGRTRSTRPRRPSPTSKAAAPRARSSSRCSHTDTETHQA